MYKALIWKEYREVRGQLLMVALLFARLPGWQVLPRMTRNL